MPGPGFGDAAFSSIPGLIRTITESISGRSVLDLARSSFCFYPLARKFTASLLSRCHCHTSAHTQIMPSFFNDLPAMKAYDQIGDASFYQTVPSDWQLVMTDVINSTAAIQDGRYKEVNISGALAAIAVANHLGGLDYPFVFGGDGMTLLLPPLGQEGEATLRSILADTANKVAELYDLSLRVAMVPVQALPPIQVARLRISEYYDQAIISGGIQDAESLLKTDFALPYMISDEHPGSKANFQGFTCRWQDIPGKKPITFSLVVEFQKAEFPATDLRQLQDALKRFLGESHPLHLEGIELAGSEGLKREGKALTVGRGALARMATMLRIRLEQFACVFAKKTGLPLKSGWYDLSRLNEYQMLSSDYYKFDGSLKMTLNADRTGLSSFIEYLDGLEREDKILYGIHESDRALLTCLLHMDSHREVHFVDSADGGYALAGKMLKEKRAARRTA